MNSPSNSHTSCMALVLHNALAKVAVNIVVRVKNKALHAISSTVQFKLV